MSMSASVTASSDAVAPSTATTFPIEWADPADAEKTWEWDDMHMPMCLTPLAGDYALLLAEGDAYGSGRLGIPFEFRGQVFHGYVYYVSRHDVPDEDVPAARERATARYREQIPLAAEYWRRAVDELRGIWSWMAAIPVEDLALADLADAWDEAWRRMLRACRSTSTRSSARTRSSTCLPTSTRPSYPKRRKARRCDSSRARSTS
jgi:hypothetical protein